MNSTSNLRHDRQVAAWLLLCAATVFGMIVLGGVTRLTDSGLSMVEWKPLMGVIPPLSEQAWLETFDKYKQFPEYQQINRGMSLEAFKTIFMYEYLHRMLGRLIGVLFLVPMVFFACTRRLRPGLAPRLFGLFLLGGLQGLLGWYMVKSGLVDNPHVSQYRLTAHLGLAVLIYGLLLWLAVSLLRPRSLAARAGAKLTAGSLAQWSLWLVVLVYLMILSGGLVAGTHAGHAYNTWPLMGQSLIPPGLYAGDPAWRDAFENITTIQFNHRLFAYLLFALVHGFALVVWRAGSDPSVKAAVLALVAAVWLQAGLGISTLLLHVPVGLAAAHQAGAVVLFSAALLLCYLLRQPMAVPAATPQGATRLAA